MLKSPWIRFVVCYLISALFTFVFFTVEPVVVVAGIKTFLVVLLSGPIVLMALSIASALDLPLLWGIVAICSLRCQSFLVLFVGIVLSTVVSIGAGSFVIYESGANCLPGYYQWLLSRRSWWAWGLCSGACLGTLAN